MNFRIEQRLGIQTSSDRIWEILSALDSWHGWNPIYPDIKGELGFGEAVRLTEAMPGQPQREVVGRIASWTPLELLHITSRESMFCDAVRFFEIDSLPGGEGCIFSAGIMLQGFGAKSAGKRLGRSFKLGFATLGEALKAKAEG